MRGRIESVLPLPLRGLTAARIRRGLWNPPRRAMVWWRHRDRDGVRTLANGIPKAGSHLLKRCLDLSGQLEGLDLGVGLYGLEGRRGLRARERMMRRLGGGTYVLAHLPYSAEAESILDELGYRHVLIVRDPRDIAISRYRFETSFEHLPLHELFAGLPDDGARLATSIGGHAGSGLGDIGTRMRSYLGWRGKACSVVRYEKLVGPRGGGSRAEQIEEIDRLFRYLGLPLSREDAGSIAGELYDPEAPTFRTGKIGDWRAHFKPAHVDLFKKVAGEVLVDLGYERDLNW